MTQDFYNALVDNDIRIERAIWLPGAAACGTPSQDIREFCEEVDEQDIASITLGVVANAHEEADGDEDCFADTLCELIGLHLISGFLVQISTPVTRDHRDGGYTSSWGHYRATWRYVRTIEEIVPIAVEWSNEGRRKDREREAA